MSKSTALALSFAFVVLGCDAYNPKQAKNGIFSRCCSGAGTCVPATALTAPDAARLGMDTCDSALLCAPTQLVESASYVFEMCRSFGQAEGRCLPSCLPNVANKADRLERGSCSDAAALCVPCFDPLDGESTGACSLGGDMGPSEPPSLFTDCCEGGGRCVPSDIVDTDMQSRLGQDTCAPSSKTLCVPDLWVQDKQAFPASCHAHGGAEGRCLPRCLPEVASRDGRLLQDTCQDSELCVPCFDPVTGDDTKACHTGADPGPHDKTPVLFDKCCGTLGSCVPSQSLHESERAQLSSDGCSDADALCVPSAWVSDSNTPPATCRAFGELEGRCVPSCLPGVSARSELLRQNGCPSDFLCAPCFDPVTLENTGACNVGSDPGPKELPVSFDSCCGDLGRCVPTQAVANEDRGRLGSDSCTPASARLCAPEEWLKSPFYVPPSCEAPGGIEGRCMPACLPDVSARGDQLVQASCADAYKCVPCFDPVSGEASGACDVGHDKPSAEPKRFPTCCGGGGLCVPEMLVAADNKDRLDADSCGADSQALCVPTNWVGDDKITVPKTCSAYNGSEGRCLSSCLKDVASHKDQLRQDICAAGELCAPCFDPVDGHDSGACHIAGDGPKEPPTLFGQCCGARGRCVPPDLISSSQQAVLAADSCTTAGQLCVPAGWLGDMPAAAPTCRSFVDAEGRCLPDCLPAVTKQKGRLLTDGCAAQSACVPCYDPVTGQDTGACTAPGDVGPTEPARTFAKCCSDIGRCVPNALVSDADRARLTTESCASPATDVCVPSNWLASDFTAPMACRAPGDIEGRCLPNCLPEVSARASELRQTSCAAHELCVPCYDPRTGASTNACTIHDDRPREAPKRYEACCSGGGVCVPGALVGNTAGLGADSCRQPDTFCIPGPAADGLDPGFTACADQTNGNLGACVPSCYINPWLNLVLDADNCVQGGTKCVSCGVLSISTAVCQ